MKRLILLVLTLLFAITVNKGYAQEMTTVDSLMKYRWQQIMDDDYEYSMIDIYYENHIGRDAHHREDLITTKWDVAYYVTDLGSEAWGERWLDFGHPSFVTGSIYGLIPFDFDDSKVGVSKNGRYIVMKRGNGLHPDVYRIHSLTDKKLVLYCAFTHARSEWQAISRGNY